MDKINAIGLYSISILLFFSLSLLYLYLRGYWIKTKPQPIQIDWHAKWDWAIILIVILIAVVMGLKLITLMIVVSNSMSPEFSRGDLILTQKLDLTIQPGDIVTFTTPEVMTVVTHRVVRIDGERIRTKGDNTNIDYFQTTQKDIIAKAIQLNGHPIVIKGVGTLFITDYAKEGTISRFGDTFQFMQQLSATISTWGFVIAIIGLILLISTTKR